MRKPAKRADTTVWVQPGLAWRGVVGLMAIAGGLAVVSGCAAEAEISRTIEARGDTVFMEIEALPEWSLELELRIDGYEESLVPFPGNGGVVVDPEGRMAVLQPQDHLIRFYSPDAVETMRIGTEGDGPGEFRSFFRAGLRADTVWVWDNRLQRITFVHPDVGYVRSIAVGPILSALEGDPFSLFSPAWIAADDLIVGPASGPGAELGTYYRLEPGAAGALAAFVVPSATGGAVGGQSATGSWGASIPLFPRPVSDASASGDLFAIAVPSVAGPDAQVELRVFDGNGDGGPVRWLRWSAVPVPEVIRAEEIEARLSGLRERDLPGFEQAEAELIRQTPTVYPAVDDIHTGEDGRIWLRVPGSNDATHWLVLDSAGTPQGRVTSGMRTSLNQTDESHVWGIEADSLGVESVVRYRIIGGGG